MLAATVLLPPHAKLITSTSFTLVFLAKTILILAQADSYLFILCYTQVGPAWRSPGPEVQGALGVGHAPQLGVRGAEPPG